MADLLSQALDDINVTYDRATDQDYMFDLDEAPALVARRLAAIGKRLPKGDNAVE